MTIPHALAILLGLPGAAAQDFFGSPTGERSYPTSLVPPAASSADPFGVGLPPGSRRPAAAGEETLLPPLATGGRRGWLPPGPPEPREAAAMTPAPAPAAQPPPLREGLGGNFEWRTEDGAVIPPKTAYDLMWASQAPEKDAGERKPDGEELEGGGAVVDAARDSASEPAQLEEAGTDATPQQPDYPDVTVAANEDWETQRARHTALLGEGAGGGAGRVETEMEVVDVSKRKRPYDLRVFLLLLVFTFLACGLAVTLKINRLSDDRRKAAVAKSKGSWWNTGREAEGQPLQVV